MLSTRHITLLSPNSHSMQLFRPSMLWNPSLINGTENKIMQKKVISRDQMLVYLVESMIKAVYAGLRSNVVFIKWSLNGSLVNTIDQWNMLQLCSKSSKSRHTDSVILVVCCMEKIHLLCPIYRLNSQRTQQI